MKKDHSTLLAEKRTHLAEKRTELALERTLMGYLRTATTLVLFGIAFLGFSQSQYDFFWYAGRIAITGGIALFFAAIVRAFKHSKEIDKIVEFFEIAVKYRFKKSK